MFSNPHPFADIIYVMKQALASIPPIVLLYSGFVSVVAFGAIKLAAMLQAQLGA